MATLASPPMPGGMSRSPLGPPREERPSSFTAVNGPFQRGPPSEAHAMGDTITVQSDKRTVYTETQDPSRPTPPPSRQDNPYVDYRNAPMEQQQLPSPTETSVNSHKRKRSISEEQPSPAIPSAQRPRIVHGHQHSFDEQQYRQHSIHQVREIHSDGEQDIHDDRSRQQSCDTTGTPSPNGRSDTYLSNQRQFAEPMSSESERSARGYPLTNSSSQWNRPGSYPIGYQDDSRQHGSDSGSRPDSAPRQNGDAHDSGIGTWTFPGQPHNSVDGDDDSYADTPSQMNPKRKRNFSNRTKTGCMTCRKRKKKCDEAHPFCQNCSRGGFKCEGYSTRASWPKAHNPKPPVPLQSKDEQDSYSTEGPSPHLGQPQLPGMSHGNAMQPRPIPHDPHGASQAYAPSPASATNTIQPQYPSNWPANTPPSTYNAERRADYRDLPPIHNPNRSEPTREYAGVPPISEISRAPPGHAQQASATTAWSAQSSADPRVPYPPPTAASAPASAPAPAPAPAPTPVAPAPLIAPAAPVENRGDMRHHHQPIVPQEPKPSFVPMSERAEKDKMVRGHLFKFMDARLQDERKRCREALWRLNNAGNPQYGISENERARFLVDLIRPSRSSYPKDSSYTGPAPTEKATGSLGPNAHVELPFKCHYGYNLHIGEDAYIGENCTIVDACKVTIGAKTWIGANVTILTAMAHTDLQHRKGANSLWQGKEVIIEEDVYIGANVLIYPGVKLSRGSFVEPGSIVKQDQGTYGYLGYKPMYLSQSTPSGV